MLKSVGAVQRLVAEELEALRNSVFEQPPSDWAGFQKMLGQYQALSNIRTEIIRDDENEDSQR